jgi:homogentisate 1,2-dioxygenase
MPGGDAETPPDERPSWWTENERLREELSLPPYEPSRFADGVHTYRVVERLEAAHDCSLRFVALNPSYPDDWAVRADGERLFGIGRHRDEHGNTVYEMSSAAFERAVEAALGE